MDYPNKIVNHKIYNNAKKNANKTFKRHGAFKSMYIQKKYKELGGRYKGLKKSKKAKGVTRWNREKWISVKDYLNGKYVLCGNDKVGGKNACRPSIRMSSETPMTIQEVIKKHGKKKVKEIVNKKIKNMELRINWNTLTIK